MCSDTSAAKLPITLTILPGAELRFDPVVNPGDEGLRMVFGGTGQPRVESHRSTDCGGHPGFAHSLYLGGNGSGSW